MRSDCPVSYALDFFGDKWSFLIIRDLIEGKKFYKDFQNSKEKIATNILSDRLKKLEANGIVESSILEERKTMKVYTMTRKGKDLIPIVLEMILWSSKHQTGLAVTDDLLYKVKNHRDGLVMAIEARLP